MKSFKGFTLSELMVAIAVLGILCATVLPAVMNNNPNQNKLMMKKTYYIVSDVVNELVNDTGSYPAYYGICPDDNANGYIGFDCAEYSSKLPFLFSKQLNLTGDKIEDEDTLRTNAEYSRSSNADCYGVSSSCYYLETNDGIIWTFPKTKFSKGSYTSNILIGIDVNGDKKPNCYEGSTEGNCKNRKKNFDQFRIKLYANGEIEINPNDKWAKEAIYVNSSLTE